MNKNLDIKGMKFGRLTPIRYLGNNKNHVQIWECECECGNHIQTLRTSLLQGNTRSCGCLNDESRHKKRTQDNCVCPTCGTSFRVKPSRLKKSGIIFCSQKCRTEYLHEHKEMIPTYKNFTPIESFFHAKYTRWKMSARKRNIPFSEDLTPDDLISLWYSQHGLCYYTDIPMSFDKNDPLSLVSIDRIDSSKGYEKGNIVLCTYAFNSFKFNYPKDKIIEFIGKIRQKIQVKIKTSDALFTPLRGSSEAAGLDLHSQIDCVVKPNERVAIPTGVQMEIPKGFFGLCCGRSGNTIKRGLFVMNGIIDSDYRGTVGVMAYNSTNEDINISIGDRIGQIIIIPYPEIEFVEVDELSDSERGDGGYGSSGK